MEVRFKDGLDYLAQCLLDHSVFYRRYAKRSFAPILFLDFHPSHRAWLVHVGFQLGMDGGQVLFKTRQVRFYSLRFFFAPSHHPKAFGLKAPPACTGVPAVFSAYLLPGFMGLGFITTTG